MNILNMSSCVVFKFRTNDFGLGVSATLLEHSILAQTIWWHYAKPVLYEGGISRTTLSPKHVKEKRKNERGKQFNLNKNGNKKFNNGY